MKYLAVELSTFLYFVVFRLDSATVDKLTSQPCRESDEKESALG